MMDQESPFSASERRFMSCKSLLVLLTNRDELLAELCGSNGHFAAPWECAKRTLQYETLSGPYVDFILTSFRVELIIDVNSVLFTAAISSFFSLSDRLGDILSDDLKLIFVSLRTFD